MSARTAAPAITEARHGAEALAERLPPLLVAADRVAATVAQGVHGRRRAGVGEAFWQFRPYQPGDTRNRIDWRQSARGAQVFMRDQEWEAAQSIWLWADPSPSMDYSSTPQIPTKRDRALVLLLALASLLVRSGERVALLGDGRRPLGGRIGMNVLSEALIAHAGEGDLPPPAALPRFARVVLIGDFFTPLDALRERLQGLMARGVRGYLLQVLDAAEPALPFAGRIRFEGLEQDGDALIGNVDGIRARYQGRLDGHVVGLRAMARSLGWVFSRHVTDQSPEAALLSLYTALGTKAGRG